MSLGVAKSFGWKNAWLAVASGDPRRVIDALELRRPHEVGWPEGIESAYAYPSRDVFVTPPIEGWVLAVGNPLSELDSARVTELSRVLDTEVIRFGTHRVVGHDAWIRADRGRLVRAYEYTEGTIVEDVGRLSPEEIEYGLADGPPEEEITLFALADDWSIDPSTLDERGEVGLGWVGEMRR